MSTETNHTEFDRELLSAYVDGELTAAERAQVEAHLASDPAATRQVEEFRRLSGIIRGLPRPTLPADFSAKVLERANRTQPEAKPEPIRPGVSLGRSWRGWLWASAALAAALLIMVALPQQQREMARRGAVGENKQAERDAGLRNSRGEDDQVMSADTSVATDENALRTNELADEPQATSSRMSVADSLHSDSAALGAVAPEPRLLIVRVSMPPDALAKRELDQVFERNDIDVELASESEELSDEKTVDRAHELAGGEQKRLDTFSYGQLESIDGKDADAEEVVLVEAPEEQILACLETMQKDSANFYSVEIEEDSPLLKMELAQKQIAQDKWQKFNRGVKAKLEGRTRSALREEFAPPEAAPPENAPSEEAEPKDAAPEDAAPPPPSPLPPSAPPAPDALPAEGAEPAASRLESAESRPEPAQSGEKAVAEAIKSEDPKSLVPQGKAYRYWNIDEPQKRALTDLTRRRQLQGEAVGGRGGFAGGMTVEAGKQPLQVLFVIQDAPPQLAAPTADEKPLPAAEAAPQ